MRQHTEVATVPQKVMGKLSQHQNRLAFINWNASLYVGKAVILILFLS